MRQLLVERLVNGQRDVRYEETMPDEHVLVVQEDTDHVHAVWGKPEELEAAGILKPAKPKEPKTKNLERKPEKPAAKKPAAKHKAKA